MKTIKIDDDIYNLLSNRSGKSISDKIRNALFDKIQTTLTKKDLEEIKAIFTEVVKVTDKVVKVVTTNSEGSKSGNLGSKSNLDYDIDDLIYKLTRVPKHKMPEALEELKALVSPEDYLKIIEQSNRNKAEYAKQILVNL
jgi:predicted CopG family antitoxin